MDYDLRLVEEFRRTHTPACRSTSACAGTPVLRFYRWKPYCISLGKNQDGSDINTALAERDGIEVVKRPTGGKAVLHAEELTYSVVMETAERSVRESYNLISRALAEGLRTMGADLELSQSSVDFRRLFRDPSAIPCFSTSAVHEVEYHGRKLVGSAQHRFGDVLLQHGSILIGNHHKRILNYLDISDELKERTRKDLDRHTITLSEILRREVYAGEIQTAVKFGFEKVFSSDFSRSSEDSYLLRGAAEGSSVSS